MKKSPSKQRHEAPARLSGGKADTSVGLSRLRTTTSDVDLSRRSKMLDSLSPHDEPLDLDPEECDDTNDEDEDDEEDEEDDDYMDDDRDAVVCEVTSDYEDEADHSLAPQLGPAQGLGAAASRADDTKARGVKQRTFTVAKRSNSSGVDGMSPRLGHGLGMQRTRASVSYGGAAAAAVLGSKKSEDRIHHQAGHEDSDEEDDELTSERTDDCNETDELNTEDYDQDDLSDDDKELQHAFSDGNICAEGLASIAAGQNYSLRARRHVALEAPGSPGPFESAKSAGGSISRNGGPPTTKALKLLGLQERSEAATDRFNSATPMSLIDTDGGKKKRAAKIKLPNRSSGDKAKPRKSMSTSRLSVRSQSDTTLDVIERGDAIGQLKSSPKVPKQRSSIKHMRASIKSQFNIDSKPVESSSSGGSKLFARRGDIITADDEDPVASKKIAGTISELIALLFDAQHCESDKYYESDFLYLYRFFIKPKTLLKEFIELYRKKDTLPSNASAERIAESENERYRTKKRIIELIQNWTKMGFDDLNEDANFMQKLTFFINNVLTPKERTESNINIELTQLIERKNAVYKKQKEEEELAKARFIPLKPDQCHRVKKIARRLNFLEQRTKEVVEEMTLIERSLFVAIQPWEFLAVLWNSSPPTPEEMKRQQNYNMWEEHKQRLENWVISEILTRPDLTERTLTLKKFIDIARFAYKNGNLNCVHTIVTALSSPSVKRLTKTWSNLPSKSVASCDKMVGRVLSGEQTDYQAYTSLLKEGRTLPFLLPSLSVFAREISRLKETKREEASGDRSKTFVDFTTLRRATVVMQEIQGYQQRGSPALVSRPILNKFLRQQHRSLPENVIYYFSLHCESEEDGTSKEIRIDSLDPGLVYAINAGRFFVKSGSPAALASKVLDKWINSLDPDFRDAVILCRAYWLKSVDLFNKLTECYPKEAPTDTWGDYKEAEVRLPDIQERLRTVDAIRFWMEVEMHELANDATFRQQLTEFVNNTYFINSNEASFFMHLKQTFNPVRPPVPSSVLPVIAQVVAGVSEDAAMSYEYPIEEKLLSKTFPRELAECLTIIDQVMLKAIPPKELVRKAYTKPEKSPNMAGMVNHFNSISNWAASLIVLEHNQQKRAQLLVQFILAAWECRLIQNFNGSYAIVAALNNAAISRLKQTWALVPARALGRWKELEFLFDFPGAFRNYREAIAKTKPPVIPFLANYSKNLFGIEENNVVYIADGVVNFERFVMLVSQIRDLQTYQQYTYSFTVDPALYDYLVEGKSRIILSEDDCYEQSQEREGKQALADGDSAVLTSSNSFSSMSVPVSPSISARSMSSPAALRSVNVTSCPSPSSSNSAGPASAPVHSPFSAGAASPPGSPPGTPSGSPSSLDLQPSTMSSPLARSSTMSSPSRASVAMSSPLFGRANSKLSRSSSSSSASGDDEAVKRSNPIFGARLPSSPSLSPASSKKPPPGE